MLRMFNTDSYKSWKIDEKDFPDSDSIKEKIKFILGYGILAPSTFNSQPWKCKLNSNVLEIYLDLSKITKKSDKMQRFAHISMGAFIENILVAADYFGLRAENKISLDSSDDLKHISTIKFTEDKKNKTLLFESIKKRTTNRSLSENREINEKVIEEINGNYSEDMEIVVLEEKDKEEIIHISKTGDFNIWSDFGFRKEHVGWVRTNVTRKYDGMPAFGVNAGLIPSFIAPLMILSPIFPKFQIKKNMKAIKSTSQFVVLSSRDSFENWVNVGIVFEKISLMLTKYGISVSPMGQFIEDESARELLNKLVNPSNNFSPQVFFRIGYPTKHVPHSPRYPVEKILI